MELHCTCGMPHTGQRHQVIDVSLRPNWSVSPDAGLLANHGINSTEGPAIEVQELATGKAAFTILDEKERFQMVQFAPDGKSLAAVCRISGEIRLYAVPGGQVSRCLPAPKDGSNFTPEMFTFSPDGQHLAVLGKGFVHAPVCIYDAQGIRLPLHLVEESRLSSPVAFTPDSRALAVVSEPEKEGKAHLRLWDVNSGQPLRDLGEHEGLFGWAGVFTGWQVACFTRACGQGSPLGR